ncbi:phosphate-starvation-inducible PsiE family protein [Methanococcoides sp. LMO-2]|uniref:Phosphate-starvation-inducible PsiE family protein n=1 Tax=Methanococcoides cohabitans TaxID=3136559 RepID=A0ABU9KV07_9EURY
MTPPSGNNMIDNTKIFRKIIDSITTVVLYILLLTLVVGMGITLLELRFTAFTSLDLGFNHMVSSVLTIFILIDLFNIFVDYHEHERIKLTYVTDATILIVMREIAVGMYAKEFDSEFILALSALILVLGIVRVLAIRYSPEEMHDIVPEFMNGKKKETEAEVE